MCTKRSIVSRVISSIFFAFLLILSVFGLCISGMPELAAESNARAVCPKMTVSLFSASRLDSLTVSETPITPRDEWFPPPPPPPDEPDEPDETDDPNGTDDPDDPNNPDDPDGENGEPVTDYPVSIGCYDYAHPVPESDPVSDDYFSDAVFIGDSRTVGLGAYGGVDSYYYAKVALTIRGVMTIPFIEDASSGEVVTRTVIDTIREYPVFSKVYIAFGLNELGWSPTAFINTYAEVVSQIRDLLPDADIYFQAVIPVAARVSEVGNYGVTNAHVEDFNSRLQALAEKMNCFYLNVDESFYDEDGNLPDSFSSDGIHFGTAVCRQIMDFFRTHTVRHEDYLW